MRTPSTFLSATQETGENSKKGRAQAMKQTIESPAARWRERPVMSDADDTEYYAELHCTNKCGYRGNRQILIKKGDRREDVHGATCDVCGCKAECY